MESDYILSKGTAHNIFICLNDEYYRGRTIDFLPILGMEGAEDIAVDDKAWPVDNNEVERMQMRASANLGNLTPERVRGIWREFLTKTLWINDHKATVDAVTAAWFKSIGVSAAELYMITSFGEESYIERRDGKWIHGMDSVMIRSDGSEKGDGATQIPRLKAEIGLAERCYWFDGGVTLDYETMEYPQSVRTAGIGRPLREIFSHPLLDPQDLRIIDWDNGMILTDAADIPVFQD